MDPNLIGAVLATCLVLCVGAVLMLMAQIAEDTPQGGSTAVRVVSYAARPATCVPARTVATRSRGRHRK